jgi:hypothetical protein
MSKPQSLIPPRREICERLSEIAHEQRILRDLLKLSVRAEQTQEQRPEQMDRSGGARQ